MKSSIHSVVFDDKYWNTNDARIWLKQNNLKPIKRVHKINNTLRYRIIDPSIFKKFTTKILFNNIHLILGWK